jgi:chemotaxis protein MotB
MFKKVFLLTFIILFSFIVNGCMVTKDTYMKKVAEADSQAKELASLQQKYKDLTDENGNLKKKVTALISDREQLKEAFANSTRDKEKLSAEKDELDKVLQSKSDALSKNIWDLRKKVSDLDGENTSLKETAAKLESSNVVLQKDIDNLKKSKEEEVRSVKKAHEDLLQEMKAEVAKEQITITELKGKLTVDVLEKILFDSGEAEVKPEGLEVLQRVSDVLKNVKDKAIRVEGHTDNIPIKGQLAKKYPTNWELSAARAINVTRFLQKQGIDPAVLSSTAYGEYKPIADNNTSEGRAKNRRIAIILLPKE